MMPVGTVLQGKYRIEKQLSSGGFGNTYKAVVVATGSTVAVKEFFLKGVTERDTTTQMVSVSNITNYDTFVQQREKFRKESRRMSELHNPHIVAVHDSFEENGTAYYVMDYIDGESLSEMLRRTGKPLSEEEVRNILAQILDALHYVHKNKLWHLDVKPGNIMVDSTGRARLIDFGASKQIDQTTGGATAKTAVTFTSGYAPREQIEQSYKKFGPWTDIYALGATLYCLLNNKRPPVPSEIDEDQTTDKHNVLPFPNGISQELRNLIVWMMTPSRTNRPQNVRMVADCLHIQLPSEEEETDVAGVELQDDDIEVEVAEVEEGTELLDAQAKGEPHDEPEESPEDEDGEEEEDILEDDAQDEDEQELNEAKSEEAEDDDEDADGFEDESGFEHEEAKVEDKSKSYLIIIILIGIALLAFLSLFRKCDSKPAPPAAETALESWEDKDANDSVAEEDISYKGPVKTMKWNITDLGECDYTGSVDRNGKPHGQGEARFTDGRYYKGRFYRGQLTNNVEGLFKYQNGDTFKGRFEGNRFYYGTYTDASNGNYFTGWFNSKGRPKEGDKYDKSGNHLEHIG